VTHARARRLTGEPVSCAVERFAGQRDLSPARPADGNRVGRAIDNRPHISRVGNGIAGPGGIIMSATIIAFSLFVMSAPVQSDSVSVECTFANPRYAGTCVEQVTPDEDQTPLQACQEILACLNDTRCVQTYCQATTIRGGWSLVSPKPDQDEQ
jgi:hypothetical protein